MCLSVHSVAARIVPRCSRHCSVRSLISPTVCLCPATAARLHRHLPEPNDAQKVVLYEALLYAMTVGLFAKLPSTKTRRVRFSAPACLSICSEKSIRCSSKRWHDIAGHLPPWFLSCKLIPQDCLLWQIQAAHVQYHLVPNIPIGGDVTPHLLFLSFILLITRIHSMYIDSSSLSIDRCTYTAHRISKDTSTSVWAFGRFTIKSRTNSTHSAWKTYSVQTFIALSC